VRRVKRRNLAAGQRAVAAARAWAAAEAEGRILKPGETERRPSSPQKGEHLISKPREHFGTMFGAGKNQVEQAKALVDKNPVGVAAIIADMTSPDEPDAPIGAAVPTPPMASDGFCRE
jgi:hypothetical protein